MDRLQSMRVFAKVVECGSFTRAAVALDISNAIATRFIGDLEAHLGARLLNRTTRKLSLTETGQAYLERVIRILAEIDEADASAAAESQRPSGTLRIFSSVGFGTQQLATLLPAYATDHPGIVVDVTLTDRTVDFVGEGFDIGIFSGLHKFDASMIARQLGVSQLVMCASPDYIARHGAPATPQDVERHDCLNFSNVEVLRNYWPLTGSKHPAHIPVKAKMLSNNADLLRHWAAAGMGIIVSPSFALSQDLGSGRLVRLLPNHDLGQISMTMVYPSRRLLSAKVRSFVHFIATRFPRPESDPWVAK